MTPHAADRIKAMAARPAPAPSQIRAAFELQGATDEQISEAVKAARTAPREGGEETRS